MGVFGVGLNDEVAGGLLVVAEPVVEEGIAGIEGLEGGRISIVENLSEREGFFWGLL